MTGKTSFSWAALSSLDQVFLKKMGSSNVGFCIASATKLDYADNEFVMLDGSNASVYLKDAE